MIMSWQIAIFELNILGHWKYIVHLLLVVLCSGWIDFLLSSIFNQISVLSYRISLSISMSRAKKLCQM